ncbi:MAG TPA: hypothetical protein VFN10_00495 [Thermoanaerobaculia bacterium]|nr:hypothetical protein [Thermoanaerobaculia bacterium]
MQKEIAPKDWGSFFESFTMTHDHWRVSVDGENSSIPLEGIVARGSRIDIHLGADISNHRRITVEAARVLVEQRDGSEESVLIEATDGHRVALRLRAPADT